MPVKYTLTKNGRQIICCPDTDELIIENKNTGTKIYRTPDEEFYIQMFDKLINFENESQYFTEDMSIRLIDVSCVNVFIQYILEEPV